MKLLCTSFLLAFAIHLPVLAQDVASGGETKAEDDGQKMNFPEWPPAARESNAHSDYVPPPPGPYMSTALSAVESRFDTSDNRRQRPVESADFRPDMPWPARHHAPSPERWVPEGGYHFAPPDAGMRAPLARQGMQRDYPGGQYMPPQNNVWGPRQW